MLLSSQSKLDDHILKLFSQQASWGAQEILDALHLQGSSYSLAAVYKALRNLLGCGVLLRVKGRYGLSLTWLMQVTQHFDACLNLSQSEATVPFTDQYESGPWRWSFNSLFALNDAYSNLIVSLIRTTDSDTVYSWNPHPWFHLIQPESEARFVHTLQSAKVRVKKVVGGESALDHHVVALWDPETYQVTFTDEDWNLRRTEYLFVIKPFILKLTLPKNTSEAIDSFFEDTPSIDQVDLVRMRQIFTDTSGKFHLHVERNATKAKGMIHRIDSISARTEQD